MKRRMILTAMLLGLVGMAQASLLIVDADIKQNTTWDADTVRISKRITIDSNTQVIIQPGTRVEFSKNSAQTRISILGTLRAIGTSEKPIVFTVENGGVLTWQGLRFNTNGIATSIQDSSVLEYCRIENVYNWNQNGGAVFCGLGSNVVIKNNVFYNCTSNFGGGVYTSRSSRADIQTCMFDSCSGLNSGGAICVDSSSTVRISNCSFINNTAGYGGAIQVQGDGYASIENCNFVNDTAARYGGAVGAFIALVDMRNCIIRDCHAGQLGGAVYLAETDVPDFSPSFTNLTVCNNSAANGGGFYISYFWSGIKPSITNSIVWGNTADSAGQNIYCDTGNAPVIRYCDIQGGREGIASRTVAQSFRGTYENNMDADPQFNDAPLGDLTLKKQVSPCIDAGTPDTAGLKLPAYDMLGRPRVVGSRIDIDAYEYGTSAGVIEGRKRGAGRVVSGFDARHVTAVVYDLQGRKAMQVAQPLSLHAIETHLRKMGMRGMYVCAVKRERDVMQTWRIAVK